MERLRSIIARLKKPWEGWHHFDAARALFQFIREWSWLVLVGVKWGGGVGTIALSWFLLSVGWLSGYWFIFVVGGALIYTTLIPAITIWRSRPQLPPTAPVRAGGLGVSGIITVRRKPGPDSLDVASIRFQTQNRRLQQVDLGGRPQALRFTQPVNLIIRSEQELPVEFPCGAGKVTVKQFTNKGFVIEEQNTDGDWIVVEDYRTSQTISPATIQSAEAIPTPTVTGHAPTPRQRIVNVWRRISRLWPFN